MKLVISPEVRMGAFSYKIVFSDKTMQIADVRAQVEHAEQVIRLSKHGTHWTTRAIPRSSTALLEMLLHEIIHVHNHLWLGGDLTEQQIEAMASGLAQSLLSLGIEPDFSQIPEEEL